MLKTLNLSELWEACCTGNEKAFQALHYQLYPGLYKYACKILNDSETANDLLQDVFLKMWCRKSSLNSIRNIEGYFYQTTRFFIISYLREQKAERFKFERFEISGLSFSAEETLIKKEQSVESERRLSAALGKLPERQREIVYFRYYQGLNYQQIVHLTGIRYQSVINHIYRAVQLLRQEFP